MRRLCDYHHIIRDYRNVIPAQAGMTVHRVPGTTV
jgi:hypothetical protein